MTQEALKLAKIIEHFDSNDESLPLELLKEISATLRALAQTQEPWCMKMNGCKTKCEDCPDEPPQRTEQTSAERTLQHLGYTNNGGEYWKPPLGNPPQRTWVDLTSEDWNEIFDTALNKVEAIKLTKAKLKQKNGYAEEKNT